MKTVSRTIGLCVFTFGALLMLQGCAVNVVTAPHGSFVVGADPTPQTSNERACDAAVDALAESSSFTPAELRTPVMQAALSDLSVQCIAKLNKD